MIGQNSEGVSRMLVRYLWVNLYGGGRALGGSGLFNPTTMYARGVMVECHGIPQHPSNGTTVGRVQATHICTKHTRARKHTRTHTHAYCRNLATVVDQHVYDCRSNNGMCFRELGANNDSTCRTENLLHHHYYH